MYRTTVEIYSKSFLCNYLGRSLKKDVDASQTYKKFSRVPLVSIDMNGHMTNSRYHTFMDYVHVSFMMDTGIWEYAFHNQARPMVTAAYIRFRREFYWKDHFEVQFRVVAIDDSWLYVEFQFIKDDFVYCQALRKFGVHKKESGMVNPAQMLQDLGHPNITTEMPEHILLWSQAEEKFKLRALSPGI